MSTKYRNSRDVPLDIIITRLNELSDAVAGGRESQNREFTMRIPAECDRDADLVIDEAARRLTTAQAENEALRQQLQGMMTAQWKVGVDYGQAFILRKQAEAVEHYREALGMWLKELPGKPCASFVEGIISSAEQANRQAQRLHQQANELERQSEGGAES